MPVALSMVMAQAALVTARRGKDYASAWAISAQNWSMGLARNPTVCKAKWQTSASRANRTRMIVPTLFLPMQKHTR